MVEAYKIHVHPHSRLVFPFNGGISLTHQFPLQVVVDKVRLVPPNVCSNVPAAAFPIRLRTRAAMTVKRTILSEIK